MSRCRTCDLPIIWGRTEAGRKMPLDEEPHVDGRIVFVAGEEIRVLKRDEVASGLTYRSHFETCPDADQHRLPL